MAYLSSLLERRPRPGAAVPLQLTLVGLLAWPASSLAQAPLPLAIPATRYQLPNGLDVVLHEDHAAPIVYVNVTYHVGSGNEVPGKSGYAHLFEHLMFQGAKHVGIDQHFSILRAIGARGVNGTTNTERTNYYQSVPASQLETALWLESDRMGYLLPVLDQQMLDNQRDVVRNERRDRYENVAYSQELFAAALALYPEGHPYRHLTIGLHEDLQRATLDEARSFFARWYVPSNATLVLAGDFDPTVARGLIDKWFGTFPASTRPKVKPPAPPVLAAKKREVLTDALATTGRVRYVWPTPAAFAPGDVELDVIANMLASNTGRLRRLVTLEQSLARSVSAFQQSRGFSSEFHVVVDLQPGADHTKVDAAIIIALSDLTRGSIDPRELKQALAAREVGFVRGLESLASRGSQMQYYVHQGKDPDSVGWDMDRYRKVRAEDIKSVAGKFLGDKRVEIVTTPMARPRSAQAQAQARARAQWEARTDGQTVMTKTAAQTAALKGN